MSTTEHVVSVLMLGAAIWALQYLLPRARREHDGFGIACAVAMALLGLFAWLLFGVGTR
jgi:hypothetical protein